MSAHSPHKFTTLAQAYAALDARLNVETSRQGAADVAGLKSAFQLERMRALMAALGNPHESVATVHVAGSKGKGSVCGMTASMLQGCGYAVGLYTSPHMIELRERVQVNGQWVSSEDFTDVLWRVMGAADKLPAGLGACTHFELVTALALVYFAEQAVDFAVIETGMGGLLDATNVIVPRVSAITAIQGEHRQFLGSTLEEIAAHKAGIIKQGVPAVVLPQSSESVTEVFRATAERVDAPLTVVGVGNDFSLRLEASVELGAHHKVNFKGQVLYLEHVTVPLKGEHQALNCGLVLSIADELVRQGYDLPPAPMTAGLSATPRAGRLEVVHLEPRIVVDGAHNPESLRETIKALRQHMKYDSLWVVFGCAIDKEVDGMLTALASGADKVVFTRAEGNARAMDPKLLGKRYVELVGKPLHVEECVRDAMNRAAKMIQTADLILVTGSFAVAGEAKRLLAQKKQAARVEVKGTPGRVPR
jgi:dihydrofolate synthase/folylpolyglutamate synthase